MDISYNQMDVAGHKCSLHSQVRPTTLVWLTNCPLQVGKKPACVPGSEGRELGSTHVNLFLKAGPQLGHLRMALGPTPQEPEHLGMCCPAQGRAYSDLSSRCLGVCLLHITVTSGRCDRYPLHTPCDARGFYWQLLQLFPSQPMSWEIDAVGEEQSQIYSQLSHLPFVSPGVKWVIVIIPSLPGDIKSQ